MDSPDDGVSATFDVNTLFGTPSGTKATKIKMSYMQAVGEDGTPMVDAKIGRFLFQFLLGRMAKGMEKFLMTTRFRPGGR